MRLRRHKPAFREASPCPKRLYARRVLPCEPVRGTVVAILFVAVAAVAGALAYSALANERLFERLLEAGDQAVADQRAFQAIEAYSGAIARNPESVVAHLKRGSVYYAQNEL